MKYYMEFYYGNGGKCVVSVPHPVHEVDDEDYLDVLVAAAIKLGLECFYPYNDVLNKFLNDNGYTMDEFTNNEEIDEEFWESYVAGWELVYLEELGGFIQYTGLEIRPMPPNSKVGIIEQNSQPLFHRYQGMRR